MEGTLHVVEILLDIYNGWIEFVLYHFLVGVKLDHEGAVKIASRCQKNIAQKSKFCLKVMYM